MRPILLRADVLRADACCFVCNGMHRDNCNCASCFGACSGICRDKCSGAFCFCRAYNSFHDGRCDRHQIVLPQCCILGFWQGRPRCSRRPDIQTRPQQCWNIVDPDSQNARPTGLRRLQCWVAESGLREKWTNIPMPTCRLFCVAFIERVINTCNIFIYRQWDSCCRGTCFQSSSSPAFWGRRLVRV